MVDTCRRLLGVASLRVACRIWTSKGLPRPSRLLIVSTGAARDAVVCVRVLHSLRGVFVMPPLAACHMQPLAS